MTPARRLTMLLAVALATFTLAGLGAQSRDEVALRAAIETKTIKGNLKAAVAELQVLSSSHDRRVAATALLHLAECYQTLGQADAQTVYARIVREYADQTAAVAVARTRLKPQQTGPLPNEPRRVCSGCVGDKIKDFTLSPDARWVGYTAGDGIGRSYDDDLMIRDLTTGEVTRLVDVPRTDSARFAARRAIWAPDLKQIAYFYRDTDVPGVGDRSQLRVVSSQPGSQPRTLVDNPDLRYVFPTAWSPDGRSILVMAGHRDFTWQLAWVSASTGAMTVLKSLNWQFDEFGNGPELSPDGRYIAYCALTKTRTSARDPVGAGEMTLYILAADGSHETGVAGAATEDSFPVWAPDGSRVFFISDRLTRSVDLLSVAVRDGRVIGAPSVVKSGMGWAPLVGITRAGVLHYVLLDEGYPRTLVEDIRAGQPPSVPKAFSGRGTPTWSLDGGRLARAAGGGIVVASFDGDAEQTYNLNGVGRSGRPRWSSDESALLVRGQASGRTVFLRVDLRTSAVRRLTEFDAAANPSDVRSMFPSQTQFVVSPDERTVYFGAGARYDRIDRILAVDLSSGQATSIATVPGANIYAVAVRPDGQTLAVSLAEGPVPQNAGGVPEGPTRSRIATINVDGTDYRAVHGPVEGRPEPGTINVFPRLSEPVWSADGHSILFGRHEDDGSWSVWRVPSAGGQPSRVGAMASDEVKRNGAHYEGFTLTADGRRAAYSGTATIRAKNELWALDLSPLLNTSR